MSRSWNTEDLDFDAEGRLVIKNPDLVQMIAEKLDAPGGLVVRTLPGPVATFPLPGVPIPQPIPSPTPDSMCECVVRRRPPNS
jgi:hypothetical protein